MNLFFFEHSEKWKWLCGKVGSILEDVWRFVDLLSFWGLNVRSCGIFCESFLYIGMIPMGVIGLLVNSYAYDMLTLKILMNMIDMLVGFQCVWLACRMQSLKFSALPMRTHIMLSWILRVGQLYADKSWAYANDMCRPILWMFGLWLVCAYKS